MSIRRTAWLAAGLALVVAAILTVREPLLVRLARSLTVNDAVAPADFLVVLGGDAETRPFAAAALYRQRMAPRVLIFEHAVSRLDTLGLTPTHDELYLAVLRLEGVPAGVIERIPGIVDSTSDEARSLRRFLSAHPARRVILVTSTEHTRRARWVFRRVLRDVSVDVRVAPSPHLSFDETNWWRSDDGALVYMHEFLKLPYFWLTYPWESS